jgi:hypothetical protein
MDSKILTDLLPIVLIFLFAVYANEMQTFSHTSLGKLCMISIIVYYTQVDVVYGLFVCMALLLYYETLGAETILQRGRLLDEGLTSLQQTLNTAVTSPLVISDYETQALPTERYELDKYPKPVVNDSVWTNIDRYDSSTFSYSPFVSPNETNERIFNEESPNAAVDAVFREAGNIGNVPYAFMGAPSTVTPSPVPGMSILDDGLEVSGYDMSQLFFSPSPDSLSTLFSPAPDSLGTLLSSPSFSPSPSVYVGPASIIDAKLSMEEFLTRPEEKRDVISDTLSQFATRAMNGVKTLFLDK